MICKGRLIQTNFDDHAKNVEAILINPDWNLSNDKKQDKDKKKISMSDFT